jgi:hypothetical protein
LLNGSATLSIISIESDTRALIAITEAFNWDVYKGDAHVSEVHLSATNERGFINYIGDKTYRYTFSDGYDSHIDVKVVSANSATVKATGVFEDGTDEHPYTATYSLTRQ